MNPCEAIFYGQLLSDICGDCGHRVRYHEENKVCDMCKLETEIIRKVLDVIQG